MRGAALLAAHDADPVPGLEAWAADLRERFAKEFWVDSPEGGHLAIALDRDGTPVDSVTSNMGHLLGTGLLGEAATERVVRLLADPRMDSGFGLRTLSSDSPRFSRLSYHGGTVWPHDTAIAVRGLAADGHLDQAGRLAAWAVPGRRGVRLPPPRAVRRGRGRRRATAVGVPRRLPAAGLVGGRSARRPRRRDRGVRRTGRGPGPAPGAHQHGARSIRPPRSAGRRSPSRCLRRRRRAGPGRGDAVRGRGQCAKARVRVLMEAAHARACDCRERRRRRRRAHR